MTRLCTNNKGSLKAGWLLTLAAAAAFFSGSSSITTTDALQMTTHNNNNNNKVEQRLDGHGGTGLYAKEAVQAGQTLDSMLKNDVVFSADEGSVVGSVVEQFCVPGLRNHFTESCSIGASLASWRLLQEQSDEQGQQKQQQQQPHSAGLNKLSRDAGVRPTTASHASTLPWEKSRWQLPMLWSDEILHEALQYGQEQVKGEAHAPLPEQDWSDILETCDAAKRQVLNFRMSASVLAEDLGPQLEQLYGLKRSPEEISLVCHQAMGLVFSRAFWHPASGEMTMLPKIDSANHHAEPNAETQSDPDNEGGVLLVARRSIQPGEEVTITYGLEEYNTPISFSGYGFVPNGIAEKSAADRALQLAAVRGQEIAKQQLEREEERRKQNQQDQSKYVGLAA